MIYIFDVIDTQTLLTQVYPYTPKRTTWLQWLNTLRPRQNGRRFPDDNFKRIFMNENISVSIKVSLKFVPKGPVKNIPTMVQIMACRRTGDKPLSEAMMT